MDVRPVTCGTLVLLISLLGCASSRETVAPPDVDRLAPGTELEVIRSHFPDTFTQLMDNRPLPGPADGRPQEPARNILVLSAGGRDGAYSAGVLVGWSQAGTRPDFDVVTGISTGSLIAPMAFLGRSYDRLLKENFTSVRTDDIYLKRPWLSILWSDSLADSAPLRRRIQDQVTDEMLAEIAQAHRAGRRLYVGTTNLATGQLTVWDMGAIAAGPDPKKRALFQKVILASCSIPGLFPAVEFEIEVDGRKYTELHADGGISSSLFLHPLMILDKNRGSKANVYAVVAGKLSPEPRKINRLFASEFGASVQEMLESRTRGDLVRLFLLTRLTGGLFAVTSIPQEIQVDPDATHFDPGEMRKLFEAGSARATSGWRATPPGLNPEEWNRPRTGTQFRTPGE